jgi:hypothetical protein
LSSLGFERELNAIRVEPPHASVGLEVHLAMLDSRLDLRLSASTRELGLASDLALAHGLGRALGHALVPAALPFAQAHSVTPDGPRMLAELLTQLQLDPVYLASRRLSASERAQAALGGVTLLLLRSRVASAAVVARAAASSDAVSSLSRRACGVPLPLPLARLLLAGDLGPPARISASLQALRFATSLRDALDEDWFRNPRSAEVLRASLGSWAQTSEVALPGVDERGLDLSDARLGASRLGELLHA